MDVTAQMANMKITMETVFLRPTAPVCTVAKYSAQDRMSISPAKAGNWISAAFLFVHTKPCCRGQRLTKFTLLQYL